MQNMEQLKKCWIENSPGAKDEDLITETSLNKLLRSKANEQKNVSMHYFWAYLIFQIIVYGLLSYVIINHWGEKDILLVSLICLLLYLPFTIVLFLKFKQMAFLKSDDKDTIGLQVVDYIYQHHALLSSFFKFKKRYEIMLIPLSCAIMVWIIFRIYVPGGVMNYPIAALTLFTLSIIACTVAIYAENKRNFREPLDRLEEIIKDISTNNL